MVAVFMSFLQRNKGKIGLTILFCFYAFIMYRGQQQTVDMGAVQWNKETAQQILQAHQKYLHGTRVEYVTFKSSYNCGENESTMERRGILYINPRARATIIMCHGFMCNKWDIALIRHALFQHYNVLVFDFRAHGENVDEQQCCTFGKDEALDVIGAVRYAKSRPEVNKVPFICYGFSMGAVASILAQEMDPTLFDAMILDCPYDDSQNVLKHSIQKLYITIFGYAFDIPGRGLLERFAFSPYVQGFLKALLKTVAQMDATATNTYIYPASPVRAIANVRVPCFFIHCKNDEKVPVSAAKKIYENAGAVYKRLWVTNGRRHFDSIFYNPDKYSYKVQKFIEDYLRKRYTSKAPKKIVYDSPIEEPTPGF